MKWLVTGGEGLLSRALVRVGSGLGYEVVALDRATLDVTDSAAIQARVDAERPDAVIQGAAFTSVDRAEVEEASALLINAEGARNVARACQKIGCVFVYPSTDYVFDGRSERPLKPTDPAHPLNAYGRSKHAGEIAAVEAGRALIVRTSWLYGAGRPHFVSTIERLARERDTLEVVDDQVGRPTWSVTLAQVIATLLKAGALGTFHASDGGDPVSWAGFAREIVRQSKVAVDVRGIASSELERAARRPRNSVLDLSATERCIGGPLPDWRVSLASYLGEQTA